jgi:hypothetical protein
MAIEIDILIVFADKDNVPADGQESGWVSQFRDFLDTMLTHLLGTRQNILIKGEYDSLTAPTMNNVGVLLTVMSRHFAQSTACIEHVETFRRNAEPGINFGNRIFKIIKAPLSRAEQPTGLRALIGYEMYQIDSDTGEEIPYKDYFSEDAARQYWMEIVDLSYDVGEVLDAMKSGSNKPKNIGNNKTIYLADTGHDLKVQRNIIARELQRNGHTVLPTQALPTNLEDLQRNIREMLSDCVMSIHLIGHDFGQVPDGSDRSLQDVQNLLATERSENAKRLQEPFTRLIWIPPGTDQANDRQQDFISSLKRDVESQEGTELLQVLLEDFKNVIREELVDGVERKLSTETTGQSVYIMHDEADRSAVQPFIDLVKASGFEILVPNFDGELLTSRQHHIDNLRKLDAAIIFKGSVNNQWVRIKAFDLLKAPGFGRKKPIVGKAIVTASGPIERDTFKNLDLHVIDGDEKHSLETLQGFLREFKK